MMGPAKWKIRLLEKRLELFFRALLSMEAYGVEVWCFPNAHFPARRGEIALSLLNPFTGQGLHRALVRGEGSPSRRSHLPGFVLGFPLEF